jgi:hypothetical protein
MSRKIYPDDPRWAIALKAPATLLDGLRARLPEWLRDGGLRVIEGENGFGALIALGGGSDDGEPLGEDLSNQSKAAVYVLDFDDEAPRTIEFVRGTRTLKRVSPIAFLRAHGIELLRSERPERPSVVTVGLVEGVTPTDALARVPDVDGALSEHARGTLVTGGPSAATGLLVIGLKRRAYSVTFDRRDDTFSVEVIEPDFSVKQWTTGTPNPNYERASEILGETTIEGILRVLGIPPELLS